MTKHTRPNSYPLPATVSRLGLALAAYQEKYGLTLRDMAAEIGMSYSSLQRLMKKGLLPDAFFMAKIMLWLTEKRA